MKTQKQQKLVRATIFINGATVTIMGTPDEVAETVRKTTKKKPDWSPVKIRPWEPV